MLLSGVLFVLFLAGCWLYCLTDAALTPACEYRGWPKEIWLTIIAGTFIAGAVAWVIVRRTSRARSWPPSTTGYLSGSSVAWYPDRSAEVAYRAALDRHPASRAGRPGGNTPKGPDDDLEFLAQLARRIHGTPKDPTE